MKQKKHPNSLANLSREGRPLVYEEPKKVRSVTVTNAGWSGLQNLAKKSNLSISEFLEQLGRGGLTVSQVLTSKQDQNFPTDDLDTRDLLLPDEEVMQVVQEIDNMSSIRGTIQFLFQTFVESIFGRTKNNKSDFELTSLDLTESNLEKARKDVSSDESTPKLFFSDYLHPATIKYKHKNGSFVVLGLQDHDFMKTSYERSTGHKEPSWEHLHGIEVYVYSNNKPISDENNITDDEALINTGQSFKWYKDPNEAFIDFKNRIGDFNGSISQVAVCSQHKDLKEKIEKALRDPQVDFGEVISSFIPAVPPDSLFPEPWWLDESKDQNI